MRGWSFTVITIILSNTILLILKVLLSNFIITCTLKDKELHGCVSSKVTSEVSMVWLVSRLSTQYALEWLA
jgi:hypothetical protein